MHPGRCRADFIYASFCIEKLILVIHRKRTEMTPAAMDCLIDEQRITAICLKYESFLFQVGLLRVKAQSSPG